MLATINTLATKSGFKAEESRLSRDAALDEERIVSGTR